MRIGIVNDMVLAVEMIRRAIKEHSHHEIAWTALDGLEAVELCRVDLPDIVLMDLVMPRMDGVEATQKIMQSTPCPILIVTASLERHVPLIFAAMGHGALDVTLTPCFNDELSPEGAKALVKKINALEGTIKVNVSKISSLTPSRIEKSTPPLILLGASTGGPKSIKNLLESLPEDYELPIVIIQQIDQLFTTELASWLSENLYKNVTLVQEGDSPEIGKIYLAKNDSVLLFTPQYSFSYAVPTSPDSYSPSISDTFLSAAQYWPSRGIAALLTGIGGDGVNGLCALKDRGWETLAESSATSVAREKPDLALKMGGVTHQLPLHQIAEKLIAFEKNYRKDEVEV